MKIKWKGRLSETNTLPTPKITPNSVQLLEPKYNLQYYIPIIPIIIFIVLCVYLKSKFVGDITLNSLGYIIGFLLIIPFSIIHELLHAVCLPSQATAEIFYSISGLSFVITTPIPKKRYIVILLFPALMTGIIPLIIWIFIPHKYVMLNSIWFILSSGNLATTVIDLYTLGQVIRQTPKGSVIQTCGYKCYYN
ncbi:DUF3267 domain-containing protein [Clostridium sporogenes]|uniref:DUF3267 domain-containing protein n=1 Tax=unclassified Clostridium TaxID=2614128 RepID=UPI0013D6DB6E|nr:DUF3267 domain-containing protein [Clostridium sporogenes]NFS25458.1 DUF3267 domain-containing protein [Clostridium sporogenes]